jgi:hypothetical protein
VLGELILHRFQHFPVRFLNCSDDVVFIGFHFITILSLIYTELLIQFSNTFCS